MESKDYDKLYNEMESVITKYFPPGSGKGLFNFTDEPMFYEMLNEARDEAGCAVIPTEVEKENNTLSLDGYHMVKNLHIFQDLTKLPIVIPKKIQ